LALTFCLLIGCSSEPNRLECESDAEVISGSDRDTIFVTPEAPQALAVFVHGLGEQACNWVDKVEESRVATAALERGFAWVAPDAADFAWDVNLDSDEVSSIDALLADLEADERLPGGLPTLVVGHSNGGAFSQIYGTVSSRDVVLAVNANGWGTAALRADQSPPPMLFITAENDTVVRSSVVLDAATTAASRGHSVQIELHQPSALNVDRFIRIPGVDEADAAALVAAFEDAGVLDRAGRPNANPRSDSRFADAIPEPYRDLERHINDQLHVAYAEHRFSSEDIGLVFRLFEEHSSRD
jgi:pimeloyl-ACP methyl ester carboxylesterase